MTIKNDSQLLKLSVLTLMPTDIFAETLVSELIKKELISDDSDNYGKSIKDSIDGSLGYRNLVSVLEIMDLPKRSDVILTILNSTLFGFGECVECGGDMNVVDGQYKNNKQTGEKITIWEEKECQCCGYNSSK
jgi:hypothetical protein